MAYLTKYSKPNYEQLSRRMEIHDPQLLAMRYRLIGKVNRRPKSAVVCRTRKKRLESRSASELAESTQSISSLLDPNQFDWDKEFPEDYDFDDVDKLDDNKTATNQNFSLSQKIYLRMCKEMRIVPATYFLRRLVESQITMGNHALGPEGTKACATALIGNDVVELLDLAQNDIGPRGAEYIADMLEENYYINTLCLANNNIGSDGIKLVIDGLMLNRSVHSLDLSGNGLEEHDAGCFKKLLENNTLITKLHLANNRFRERGGEVFGAIIGRNDALEVLDLSWNHLRRRGAIGIAKGLVVNASIVTFNLAWNGFHTTGCRAMSEALSKNDVLRMLDLSGNRIGHEGLTELLKGVKNNSTLEHLKIKDNPLNLDGVNLFLTTIRDHISNLALTEVDLGQDQCIDKTSIQLLKAIERVSKIRIHHGMPLHLDQDPNILEIELLLENPADIINELLKLQTIGIPTIYSKAVSKIELKNRLLSSAFSLSEGILDKLLQKLDPDSSEDIDIRALLQSRDGIHSHPKKSTVVEVSKLEPSSTNINQERVRLKLRRLMDVSAMTTNTPTLAKKLQPPVISKNNRSVTLKSKAKS